MGTNPSPGETLDLLQMPGGIALRLRVQPKARHDRIVGLHGGALKVQVRAAPESGKANEAVLALIAESVGVARASVSLLSGATSRDKRVLIHCNSPTACQAIEAHLHAILCGQ